MTHDAGMGHVTDTRGNQTPIGSPEHLGDFYSYLTSRVIRVTPGREFFYYTQYQDGERDSYPMPISEVAHYISSHLWVHLEKAG